MMSNAIKRWFLVLWTPVVGVAAAGSIEAPAAEEMTLAQLARNTHFHGIAVDPTDPSRVLLATHHGFFRVAPDGKAELVSQIQNDFMGFTPHPTDPSILFSSGHPPGGGNLGFLVSKDGGASWEQISPGASGTADFHSMDVSAADAQTVYGSYGGLQVSRDGGHTWQMVGPAPEGLIDLAVSSLDANRLYAATRVGLEVSSDGGQTWQPAHTLIEPVSMVESHAGQILAFMRGQGLIGTHEDKLGAWTSLNNEFGDRYIMHLAIDPANADRMVAATDQNEIWASADGGRTWSVFGTR